ncbi:class I SAM-dependent methyltransferase [Candidatus Pelagibacter sp.]|nr:class I SAM-dependent methyltransferase [Candidatus Pelagibacter sp.]
MKLINKIYSNYSELAPNINKNSEQNFEYFDQELNQFKDLKEKKIIEIGYGNGFFLDWAKKKQLDITGYEINEIFHQKAKLNHKVVLGEGVNISSEVNDKFDLIVLFDVIEHISKENLLIFFENLHKLLNANGQILLRFPNGSSAAGLEYFNSDLTHYTFFNKRSLKMVAELNKFELIYFGNMKRVNKFKSLRGKLFGRFVYLLRNLIEYIYGNLYFGEKIPLDPNVVGILKKI